MFKSLSHVEGGFDFYPNYAGPRLGVPFEVMCDASDYIVGVGLGQRKDNKSYDIYYTSRTFDDAQMNYAITEKEFLAVLFTLEKFHLYLINSRVIIFIDYAALKCLLKKFDSKPHLIRWLLLLQEFYFEIQDKAGHQNVVGDHLSRLDPEELPIDDFFPNDQLLAISHQGVP